MSLSWDRENNRKEHEIKIINKSHQIIIIEEYNI